MKLTETKKQDVITITQFEYGAGIHIYKGERGWSVQLPPGKVFINKEMKVEVKK